MPSHQTGVVAGAPAPFLGGKESFYLKLRWQAAKRQAKQHKYKPDKRGRPWGGGGVPWQTSSNRNCLSLHMKKSNRKRIRY